MLKPTPQAAELFLIPARVVPSMWPLAHDYIERACIESAGEYTPDMLINECFVGVSQLWLVWSDALGCEAAVVTGVLPHCKVCLIKACGGRDRGRWLGLLDEIETWAKNQGCTTMRLFGRLGWRKVLKDYRVKRVVMDKEL